MNKKIIPIFPLDLVLFPRQQLPLRIFEPRYKQLVDDCLLGDGQFGVCLIDEKNTVNGWQAPKKIGTITKISKCKDIDIAGTHLYIETIGHSKFKINEIIPPSIPLPYDYDPYTAKGLQKMALLHEQIGTNEKLYIQAKVEMIPEICESISLDKWKKLVELWKEKIIIQALPKIVNPFALDHMLNQYGLATDVPTIDYIYSLSALGASTPQDLQPILEADNFNDLIQLVEELFKRR